MDETLDYVRFLMSVILFSMGIYLILDLFLTGFDVKVQLAAAGCFVLVHFIRPQWRSADKADWYDAFDLILDFPFRAVAYLVRLFFRSADID